MGSLQKGLKDTRLIFKNLHNNKQCLLQMQVTGTFVDHINFLIS